MNNSFDSARHIFQSFREHMATDVELRTELEGAIDMLRSAYNTTIRENRFIVGGAIEHFVVATFNGGGFPAQHIGRGDTRIDVMARISESREEAGFSVKASFSTLSVRLINMLGESVPKWSDPTLFFLTGIGIVYADPDLLPNATKHAKDAIVLDGRALKAFIGAHPEYVIPLHIEAPKTGKIASSKTASEDVARSIVKNFKRLSLP